MRGINKYFYIIATVVTITFIVTTFVGIKQVSDRKLDYNKAINAISNIKNNKYLEDSIKDLEYIEGKYGDIYKVNIYKANAYFAMKDYDKALSELKNSFEIEESTKSNSMLVYLYAKTSYLGGHEKEAKVAMKKAKELGVLNQDISAEDMKFIEELTKE